MEIIVKLIESLAWPVTVLIIVFIFRKELTKVVSRLSNLKYKDFEAQFNNDLANIEKKTSQLSIKSSGSLKISGSAEIVFNSNYDRLLEIAKLSPRAAIMSAWFEVENAIYSLNKETVNQQAPSFKQSQIISELVNKNVLAETVIDIFRDLKQLRNQAVHYPEFALTQKEAEKYIDLALKLSSELLRVKNQVK
ncbi:MAG: hypothetical protein A2499_17105 [Stygiobacter sp. RIFOXYC12_FULL_38_8]|nr:MAG: hypothetical protein A2X62_03750 [Stygiobacter sp. GWC2_38_9]OGU79332.1 MAG: hypothetical protein A2279_01475 [Stygiobacter sp. RIFOXYA12_FULL_38_9]OGV15181.1 MAG: hypothetical protein A2440_19460 [Stygiobacter sp. RIFOXYC2_FULL_38_25]OGV17114.1 MAG: hypothetical protein A2237_05255 [Stygiobacter sp. RIFOXYA2_FULL_38_8]OGV24552.1 MAG: hypothetical protein A2499_17105 [Stygiobacter sp. RIFOXYC12_FULL_38_8]OGV79765.1 MAG: hypothetical protein A2X65_10300 [Stygiobacter sp. GWF2_38_21]